MHWKIYSFSYLSEGNVCIHYTKKYYIRKCNQIRHLMLKETIGTCENHYMTGKIQEIWHVIGHEITSISKLKFPAKIMNIIGVTKCQWIVQHINVLGFYIYY